jgi:hypothetical protein
VNAYVRGNAFGGSMLTTTILKSRGLRHCVPFHARVAMVSILGRPGWRSRAARRPETVPATAMSRNNEWKPTPGWARSMEPADIVQRVLRDGPAALTPHQLVVAASTAGRLAQDALVNGGEEAGERQYKALALAWAALEQGVAGDVAETLLSPGWRELVRVAEILAIPGASVRRRLAAEPDPGERESILRGEARCLGRLRECLRADGFDPQAITSYDCLDPRTAKRLLKARARAGTPVSRGFRRARPEIRVVPPPKPRARHNLIDPETEKSNDQRNGRGRGKAVVRAFGALLLVLGPAMTSSDVQRFMHGEATEIPYPGARYSQAVVRETFWGRYRDRKGDAPWRAGLAEVAGWAVAGLGAALLALAFGQRRESGRCTENDDVA